MSEKPKIVYEEAKIGLSEIRDEAMESEYKYFVSMCMSRDVDIRDVVDLMDEVRYLKGTTFTSEAPRLLSYEEVNNAKALLCWLEEICYDSEWAEEGDRNTVSDWLSPCFVVASEIFTDAGEGDIGEIEEYGKVTKDRDGGLFGRRFWTGGRKPTYEQMKSEKWEGLEGYEYE